MLIGRISFVIVLLVMLIFSPNVIHAEIEQPLPFLPADEQTEIKQSDSFIDFAEMNNTMSSVLAIVYKLFLYIMTIIFLLGLVLLVYGLITKHGQRSKSGKNMLWSSFIVMLVLRIAPIIVLTVKGLESTLIVRDFITLILSVGIYLSIGSAITGAALYGLGRMINHPSYERWGKGLGVGAVTGLIFTNIAPYIFTIN